MSRRIDEFTKEQQFYLLLNYPDIKGLGTVYDKYDIEYVINYKTQFKFNKEFFILFQDVIDFTDLELGSHRICTDLSNFEFVNVFKDKFNWEHETFANNFTELLLQRSFSSYDEFTDYINFMYKYLEKNSTCLVTAMEILNYLDIETPYYHLFTKYENFFFSYKDILPWDYIISTYTYELLSDIRNILFLKRFHNYVNWSQLDMTFSYGYLRDYTLKFYSSSSIRESCFKLYTSKELRKIRKDYYKSHSIFIIKYYIRNIKIFLRGLTVN